MVSIHDNIGRRLYSIDWEEGIIDITKYGVQHFLDCPDELSKNQPKGLKFKNEAQKMFEYLKYKNKRDEY